MGGGGFLQLFEGDAGLVNLLGDLALAPSMDVAGIALSTTLTYLAAAAYVAIVLRRRLRIIEPDAPPRRGAPLRRPALPRMGLARRGMDSRGGRQRWLLEPPVGYIDQGLQPSGRG